MYRCRWSSRRARVVTAGSSSRFWSERTAGEVRGVAVSVSLRPPKRGRVAVVRFVGSTDFANGDWVGVELFEPEGLNDGSVQGTRYQEGCAFCRQLPMPSYLGAILGALLGPPGASEGHLWAMLGNIAAVLGALGVVLGLLGGHLGAVLGPS